MEGGLRPSVLCAALPFPLLPFGRGGERAMSVVFVPERVRGKAELLEENDQLIRCIVEYQNKGRAAECMQHQHTLHRNLIYLATIADAAPSPTAEKTAAD
ncbi:hypothetical protein JRQ81_006426 [Phrynocephalus forsythii]|uniref:SS18 N-terminal domain-containing protein n=1 Tax=Phrynocephalus forsythii TaxID=171643 RepID=A0A9Q1AUT1_9SAUR|nr:hypothetical protein JRQ81_006426 [Phrynocephalus forsythii]